MKHLFVILCLSILTTTLSADSDAMLRFEDISAWNGLEADTELFSEGAQSGAWKDTVTVTRVRNRNFPSDLSQYKGMKVSIHSATPSGASISIIFLSENEATDKIDYYMSKIEIDWSGWKEVTIPFKTMRTIRNPNGWDQITEFRMASSKYGVGDPSPDTQLHFDKIEFIPSGTVKTEVKKKITVKQNPSGAGSDGFEDILGFENPGNWPTMSPDSENKKSGNFSGSWDNTVETDRIKAKKFPSDLGSYSKISIQVYSQTPTLAQIALIFNSENPATDGDDYYLTNFEVDWSGWKQITLDLGDSKVVRSPLGWDQITGFLFASSKYGVGDPHPDTKLKFDNIQFLP